MMALPDSFNSAVAAALAWLTGSPAGAMIGLALAGTAAWAALTLRRRSGDAASASGAARTAVALRRPDAIADVLSAFESETAAVFERTRPASSHTVLYALIAMIAGSLLLTGVVKLDRVVTGTGRISTAGGELYVSPLDRSIVREVHVRTGDIVRKGQVLATLDATFAGADLAQLQQRLDSQTHEVARRRAEAEGKPYVAADSSPYALLQAGIYRQRQAEYRAALDDFDSRISSMQAAAAQHRRDIEEYEKRLVLAMKTEQMNIDLRRKGYVTQQQLIVSTDARLEVGRLLASSQGQLSSTLHNLESIKAQRAGFIQKWHSDTAAEHVAVQNQLDTTREQLRKAEKLNELVTLEAPEDAVVLKVGKISQGSVAEAAEGQEPLFTLVPLSATLEAEIEIGTNDIGFIQAGDPVQLKLDAYSFVRHGTAKGIIKTISEGSFTFDQSTRAGAPSYFKARIDITEAALRNVPGTFRLIPGMTLQADVMVGSRTILSYLVDGVLRTGSEAMREPN